MTQGLAAPQGTWPELASASCHTFSGQPVQPGWRSAQHISLQLCSARLSFCTAQHISGSLPHTQASTNHFSGQKGGWGSGPLLSAAASQQSTASPALSSGSTACHSVPHLSRGLDQPITHSTAPLPRVYLVQSHPGELRAACLFWVTSAHLPCFCYLKSLSLSLSLPLQMALQRPWECTAAPIMSPRFLVSCTLSRKVTRPDNIIYIAV